MRRAARKKPRQLDTKARLLTTAARVFAEVGYRRASMDEIAAQANMTKGAVYWHFADKPAFFAAVFQEYDRRCSTMERELVEAASSTGQGPAGLLTLAVSLTERLLQEPYWHLLLAEFYAERRQPKIRELLDRRSLAQLRTWQMMARLIGDHYGLPDEQRDTLALKLLALTHGALCLKISLPESMGSGVVDSVVRDLLSPPFAPDQ